MVIAGVHVGGLEGGASKQHCLALRHLQQHVGGQERGAVVLGQNLYGEFVSGLMLAVGNAEDRVVLGSVAVIMVIADYARFDLADREHEALSTWKSDFNKRLDFR